LTLFFPERAKTCHSSEGWNPETLKYASWLHGGLI
jgi:hypothetical protein